MADFGKRLITDNAQNVITSLKSAADSSEMVLF